MKMISGLPNHNHNLEKENDNFSAKGSVLNKKPEAIPLHNEVVEIAVISYLQTNNSQPVRTVSTASPRYT